MKKKGQITLFIIIGILIIFAIAIVLYTQRERVTVPVEAERVRIAPVPTEMQPLQNFVQTCLSTVAKQGLKILGERGGYIKPRFRFNPFQPTEGEAVQFGPDSALMIPYWWHMNARNDCVGDCTFTSEKPPLARAEGGARSIEGQLDTYITEELPGCLGKFAGFSEQQYSITPTGALQPKTQITRQNVIAQLTYPIEVRRAGETFTLKDFAVELPVNLYEIYMLASNITNLEAQNVFLEHATRQLIDIFGKTEEDSIPPVSDFGFGVSTGIIWTKMDIEERLEQIITSYIPLLRVTYTKNYRYIPPAIGKDTELYEVVYNRGFIVPVLEPHQGLTVTFSYLPWWKPYFDLNCNGQLCQGEGIASTLGMLFGIRRYLFAYDLSYPVLIEIKNPDALNGEGYTFRFALEANMRNNEPLAELEPVVSVNVVDEQSSLLCDAAQRTGSNVTVNVHTSTGKPIDNAKVLYTCGTETCSIGTTTKGMLYTAFPRCVGGFVGANHADYAGTLQPFDVIDESQQTINLTLGVAYPVDFAVKKWQLKKHIQSAQFGKEISSWELDSTESTTQGPQERTIILLEKKGNLYEEPIIIFGDICGSPVSKANIPCGNPPSDESKDIRIYAGNYHVTINSFMYPSPVVQIPPDRRCFKREEWKKKKCINVPKNQIIFDSNKPFLSGYAEYDWSINEEELRNAKIIEFSYINFALEKVLPAENRKIEDLDVMGNLFSYSDQYKNLLKPRIS